MTFSRSLKHDLPFDPTENTSKSSFLHLACYPLNEKEKKNNSHGVWILPAALSLPHHAKISHDVATKMCEQVSPVFSQKRPLELFQV